MANGELLTDQFPQGPYNWNTTNGPLKVFMTVAEGAIETSLAVLANLTTQLAIETATGVYLRQWAVLYGITPSPGETDDQLRAQIQGAINAPRLTTIAIQALVQAWFNANFASPPTVFVYDKQTDPVLAAEVGLVNNEFVIQLSWALGLDDGWFLDYEYLNYTTYLGLGYYYDPPNALDILVLTRWKAAGFGVLWINNVTYGNPPGRVGIADQSSIVVDP